MDGLKAHMLPEYRGLSQRAHIFTFNFLSNISVREGAGLLQFNYKIEASRNY
jgi:hypothetical protein